MGKTEWLCLIPEDPRTFSEREHKFTVKFFTLQFFAHFSSLIYIAFILGRYALLPHMPVLHPNPQILQSQPSCLVSCLESSQMLARHGGTHL